MLAGVCTTVTLSVFDTAAVPWLVWVKSPPPHADAVLLTDTAEVVGIFTVSVIVVESPAAIPGVPEHETMVVPLQVKRLLADVYEASE
jgi:hypothetical protein